MAVTAGLAVTWPYEGSVPLFIRVYDDEAWDFKTLDPQTAPQHLILLGWVRHLLPPLVTFASALALIIAAFVARATYPLVRSKVLLLHTAQWFMLGGMAIYWIMGKFLETGLINHYTDSDRGAFDSNVQSPFIYAIGFVLTFIIGAVTHPARRAAQLEKQAQRNRV